MDLNVYIGNQIKTLRESRGMTQDQLADKLNTTRQTISRYENGDRKTNQDTLFALSKIFNVSVNHFFPEDQAKEDSSNAELLAAHIDDDASSEDIQDIIDYIEFKKRQIDKRGE